MTTDDLTERIGRILNDEGWTFEGVHEPGDYDECEDCRLAVAAITARIAGEITSEVRAAKAEALRGLSAHISEVVDNAKPWQVFTEHVLHGAGACDYLDRAATEYETGDQT